MSCHDYEGVMLVLNCEKRCCNIYYEKIKPCKPIIWDLQNKI